MVSNFSNAHYIILKLSICSSVFVPASTTSTMMSPEQDLLPCREDFFREEGSEDCVPSCYTWREYSDTEVIVVDVLVLLATVIGLVAGLVVLVISLIRFKRM